MESIKKDRQIIKLYERWQQAEIDNKQYITELIKVEFCDNKKVLRFIDDLEVSNKNLMEVLENPKLLNECLFMDNQAEFKEVAK